MKKYSIISYLILAMILVSCYVSPKNNLIKIKGNHKEYLEQILKIPHLIVFDNPPIRIKVVPPIYPNSAKYKGIQGEVQLEVEKLISGNVGSVVILRSVQSGHGGIDESAVNSIKQWKFQFAKKDGKHIACFVKLAVRFSLD